MNVAFYGVTAWGNAALEHLLDAGVDVWRVFTRTEAGPCPHFPIENFADFARRRGCAVIVDRTPDDDRELLGEMQRQRVDLLISAGFHRKIGTASIAAASLAVNIHPSLLPRYRGSAPSNWVIVNGEQETGVTLHGMTSTFDGGPIYIQRRMPIGTTETAGELRRRQAVMVGEVLSEFLAALRHGSIPPPQIQDEREATTYRAITRDASRVDPTGSVKAILNLVRGTTPWPGPWLEINGTGFDILDAAPAGDSSALPVNSRACESTTVVIPGSDGAVRYHLSASPRTDD